MIDFPFQYRVAFLLLIGVAVVIWDQRNPTKKRYKHREYLFLALLAVIGSLYGVLVDLITTEISKEYFVLGKKVADNDLWQKTSLLLGAKAGFIGGALAACAILVSAKKNNKVVFLVRSSLPILFFSVFFALIFHIAARFNIYPKFKSFEYLYIHDIRCFMIVWMTHAGVYAGAIVGLFVSCVRLPGSSKDLNDQHKGL